MICENDYDCEGRQVCYSDVTWLSEFTSTTNVTSNCFCYGFFGWEGPDCLDFGIQSYLWIGGQAVLLLVSTVSALYFGFRGLYFVYTLGLFRRPTAVIFTYLSALIALIARMFTSVVFVLNLLDAEGFGKLKGDDAYYTSQKRGSYEIQMIVGQIIGVAFTIHAGLNVGLVWTSVAYNTKNMKAGSSKKLIQFSRLVRFIQLIFVIAFTFCAAFEPSNVFALGFFMCLVVFWLYCITFKWLSGQTVSLGSSSSYMIERAFKKIRKSLFTLIIVYILILLTCIPLIALALTVNEDVYPDAQRELMKPGEINAYAVLFLMTQFFLLGSSAVIIWYVTDILKDAALKERRTGDNEESFTYNTALSKSSGRIMGDNKERI